MKFKRELIIFLVVVALGCSGYFGWNFYSNRLEVYAYDYEVASSEAVSAVGALAGSATSGPIFTNAAQPTGILLDAAFYAAYKAYMSWVDRGVQGGNGKINKQMITKLQMFYVVNLKDVRYAYTKRFSNLGMTDCKQIYFGNKDIVDKLKKNQSLTKSQLHWFAHELAHAEQCQLWGGRKKYALKWFKQVQGVILNAIKKGKFDDIIKDIFNAQGLAKYDNNMSMEQYAEKRADAVVKSLMP